VTYADSGVDIEKATSPSAHQGLVKKTFHARRVSDIGLFGGLFEFDSTKWKKPVLVSSTTEWHQNPNRRGHEALRELGRDMVGHSIDDILVQGANSFLP